LTRTSRLTQAGLPVAGNRLRAAAELGISRAPLSTKLHRYGLIKRANSRPREEPRMTAEFQVQKAGLAGGNWQTVCRGSEARAREIFLRQLKLHSVGRFRLLDATGLVIEERRASPLFGDN